MLEGLPLRVRVDPVVDLLVIGEIQVAQRFDGAECGGLRSEIRAAEIDRLHLVAHCRVDALKIADGDLALALEDLVDVVLAAARGHIPLRNVAYAFWMFEPRPRNMCDVAEPGAAEAGNHAAAGRGRLFAALAR